jgi:hypothetical protein
VREIPSAWEAQEEEPVLAALASASVRGTHALDGRRVARLRADSPPAARLRGRLCAEAEGCNVHAGTYVPAWGRRRLEDLIRYLARPPLGDDRLTRLPDGQVAVRLKRPKPDGTTAIILPPDELICRVAALVPRPFKNGLVYFGVFSGHAGLRPAVVPGGRDHPQGGGRKSRRVAWDQLLFRAFGIQVRRCPCGATFELIAEIHTRAAIRAILTSLGLPAEPLPITRPRPPPDDDLEWAA